MAPYLLLVFVLSVIFPLFYCNSTTYEPNWASLDSRPLPSWFDEAKFGIFMHWGVFSVPAFGGEWFWWDWKGGSSDYVKFVEDNYPSGWTYADFASQFRAEMFDPDFWADLIHASGAKYYVITTKHHEGFCNWKTKVSFNWNSMDIGPRRDLVGELATAIRNRTDVHFGIYHSLYEWFNELYLLDKANNYTTQYFVKTKTMPELYELVNNYQPEVVWSDGDWEAVATYWNATNFLAWLYNESPVKDTVVVNDRWGTNCRCKHGDYYTCQDRYNPGVKQGHKWENAMTVDKDSWGIRRQAQISDYLTPHDLITELASTVSCGGNLLVNVGPTADGRILPIFEERLRQIGSWLAVNGEAIYKSESWTYQNDTITTGIWYTMRRDLGAVYVITLEWPKDGSLFLRHPIPTSATTIQLLGYEGKINFEYYSKEEQFIVLDVSRISPTDLPCQWAWVFKMNHIEN